MYPPSVVQPLTEVTVPSASKRVRADPSAPINAATSALTASNTSAGGAPAATSVATRRNAACSSASRVSASWASPLAIAVATNSVNSASRSSRSSRSGASGEDVEITPQTRPSTLIGAPATLLNPYSRAAAASEPGRSAYSLITTGRTVRSPSADIDGPSSGQQEPGTKASGLSPWTARTVIVEVSWSYRPTAAFINWRT